MSFRDRLGLLRSLTFMLWIGLTCLVHAHHKEMKELFYV